MDFGRSLFDPFRAYVYGTVIDNFLDILDAMKVRIDFLCIIIKKDSMFLKLILVKDTISLVKITFI